MIPRFFSTDFLLPSVWSGETSTTCELRQYLLIKGKGKDLYWRSICQTSRRDERVSVRQEGLFAERDANDYPTSVQIYATIPSDLTDTADSPLYTDLLLPTSSNIHTRHRRLHVNPHKHHSPTIDEYLLYKRSRNATLLRRIPRRHALPRRMQETTHGSRNPLCDSAV
jgi:hypothetical protein